MILYEHIWESSQKYFCTVPDMVCVLFCFQKKPFREGSRLQVILILTKKLPFSIAKNNSINLQKVWRTLCSLVGNECYNSNHSKNNQISITQSNTPSNNEDVLTDCCITHVSIRRCILPKTCLFWPKYFLNTL